MSSTTSVGDMWVGVCIAHKTPIPMAGIIVMGGSTTTTDGNSSARIGDLCIGFCGHVGVIVSSSGSVTTDGCSFARIGDMVVGQINGVIVSGKGPMAE